MSVVLLLTIAGCTADESLPDKRSRRIANQNGDILIACVDSSSAPSFFKEGVSMRVEEINARGGILDRKLKVLFFDDAGEERAGEKVARDIAANPDISAVIGHRNSNVAIPASITYEENGILFISTGATHPSLTRYSKNFTFRNIPADDETGRQIVELISRKAFKNLVIFYQRDFEGKRLAEILHENAVEKGINVVSKRSFFAWQDDFKADISLVRSTFQFDAIFIAGALPASAILIKQIRDMGITAPIIGGSGLDSPMLISEAGRAAEGTVVSTVFNPKSTEKNTRDFINRFEEKLGFQPDTWAAQGYDAVSLLDHIMEASLSTVPQILVSTLRFLEKWDGVTGAYSFTKEGNITGKTIFFKEVKNGKFEFLKTEKESDVDPYIYVDEFTLRLPVEGVISTVDPGFSNDITSIEVVEQLFMGLTSFDPESYKAVPELATGWTTSENGLTYRFSLRRDAFWTNGDPVTAHDVVWAIHRNIAPETKSANAPMLYILKNASKIHSGEIKDISAIGVKAIDDFTVEFILENPAAYFPSIAGVPVFRPLPKKIIEQFGNRWTEPDHIVTNGSYKLALWKKDMVMVLKKNPLYFAASNVSIPEVRYFIIPQSSSGLAMYKNNELDIMGSSYLRLPMEEIERINQDPALKAEYHREGQSCTYAFAFNIKIPPVDNVKVRKAIAAAIPKGLIIEVVTQGGEEPANTYTPWPLFGAVDPEEGVGIKYNPVKAKEWLAEAGYPDGEKFPEILLLYNNSETHKKIAQAVQSSLKHNLNITVKLVEKEWDDYIQNITAPSNYHMFRAGYCSDYPDANNWLNDLFHPSQPTFCTGLDNPEFASVLNQTRMEVDLEKRKALFKRAEQILCEEEVALAPIYYEKAHCLVKPRVKGWRHMAMGGQHIRKWYFEEK